LPVPTLAAVVSPRPAWWRQAVVYQIYPRSFADADGDGLGDLRGITDRVAYLARLGIGAVWLSPFYPSALADGGYDVDDYRDVDPRLGTLEDFDAMAAALHGAGIRVIVDIVPNHSSDRHAWWVEAVASPPGSAARARYHIRDGAGPDGSRPPTDWISNFGGPAWSRLPDGQWYLHLFAPEQPDLNWENPEVREDFHRTLRFWSDRGVDGFRVDVAHGLAKDLRDPLPAQAELAALGPGRHPFHDRDEVHAIFAGWRRVLDEYDPPRSAVAEAWVHPDRRPRYAMADGLGQAFNFDLLRANWDAGEFGRVITANLERAARSDGSSTWVLANHDVVRHPTRYGLPRTPGELQDGRSWVNSHGTVPALDRDLGLRRARAATLLVLALPGSAYLYQGEELGLHEVGDLPDEALQDPAFLRSEGVERGRDGCRVPLPWTDDGPSFGFGAGPAHLPQPAWFAASSVSVEEATPSSTLHLYRRALQLRRSLLPADESLSWEAPGSERVLQFVRPGGWHSVTNFGEAAVALPAGEVVLASGDLGGGSLPPDTTAWLRV
jgi:alpha-glucosidase